MAATMIEMKGLTTIKVDTKTQEAEDMVEIMIETIVFQVKIATEDRTKSRKTGDFAMREVITHLE
jgi:hypothetical protein